MARSFGAAAGLPAWWRRYFQVHRPRPKVSLLRRGAGTALLAGSRASSSRTELLAPGLPLLHPRSPRPKPAGAGEGMLASAGGRDVPISQTLDLFPTLLAAAGLPVPPSDGSDLRRLSGAAGAMAAAASGAPAVNDGAAGRARGGVRGGARPSRRCLAQRVPARYFAPRPIDSSGRRSIRNAAPGWARWERYSRRGPGDARRRTTMLALVSVRPGPLDGLRRSSPTLP